MKNALRMSLVEAEALIAAPIYVALAVRSRVNGEKCAPDPDVCNAIRDGWAKEAVVEARRLLKAAAGSDTEE